MAKRHEKMTDNRTATTPVIMTTINNMTTQTLDDYNEDHGGYDFLYGRMVADAVIPKIAATLSILGSLTIMAEVICDHRQRKNKNKDKLILSRILFHLSCADLCSSTAWIASTWAMPM